MVAPAPSLAGPHGLGSNSQPDLRTPAGMQVLEDLGRRVDQQGQRLDGHSSDMKGALGEIMEQLESQAQNVHSRFTTGELKLTSTCAPALHLVMPCPLGIACSSSNICCSGCSNQSPPCRIECAGWVCLALADVCPLSLRKPSFA